MNTTVLKLFAAFFLIVLTVGLLTKKTNPPEQKIVSPQPMPTVARSPQKPTFIFNLKGPTVCRLSEKGASISAYIKDETILVMRGDKEQFLLKGDCLYRWESGKYSGERMCGLSPYVGIFKQISSFGFFGMKDVLSMIDKLPQAKDLTGQKKQIESLLATCRQEEIQDIKLFDVPKNILFRNRELK